MMRNATGTGWIISFSCLQSAGWCWVSSTSTPYCTTPLPARKSKPEPRGNQWWGVLFALRNVPQNSTLSAQLATMTYKTEPTVARSHCFRCVCARFAVRSARSLIRWFSFVLILLPLHTKFNPKQPIWRRQELLWLLCIFSFPFACYLLTHTRKRARTRTGVVCMFCPFSCYRKIVCFSLFFSSISSSTSPCCVCLFLRLFFHRVHSESCLHRRFDSVSIGVIESEICCTTRKHAIRQVRQKINLPSYGNEIWWYGLVRFVLHNRYWTVQ